MNLIFEPRVYLIGMPMVNDEIVMEFLDKEAGSYDWETDTIRSSEELCEIAGRVCYMSFTKPRPGGNAAYLGHIIGSGHGSVLEHAVFNLILAGISRSLSHELVRHRAGMSYSQLSQRYVDESDVAFVVPPGLEAEVIASEVDAGNDPATTAGELWKSAMELAQNDYVALSSYLCDKYAAHIEDRTARRKAAREAARSVLPNATETKVFVSGNARAWRHFIEMRANPAADAEIRRLAIKILGVLQEAAPNLFGDYTIEGDGASTPHRKV